MPTQSLELTCGLTLFSLQERDVLVERVLKENGVLREQLQLALAQVR
jgi:hypothetical protein